MTNNPEENPYIVPDEPIVEPSVASKDCIMMKLNNKRWTARETSPMLLRKNKNSNNSMKQQINTTDEEGYEVPIRLKQPVYVDLEAPSKEDETLPKGTNEAKPNKSFLAKYIREKNLENQQQQQHRNSFSPNSPQSRRLPCSPPPTLSASLPADWEGNLNDSLHYEEIPTDSHHLQHENDDHDYVEIEEKQGKELLQSVMTQQKISPIKKTASESELKDTNIWQQVAMPGVLRAKSYT